LGVWNPSRRAIGPVADEQRKVALGRRTRGVQAFDLFDQAIEAECAKSLPKDFPTLIDPSAGSHVHEAKGMILKHAAID